MKVIQAKSADRQAIYLFPDLVTISITDYMMDASDGSRSKIPKPNTHEILENVPGPELFVSGAMTYTGSEWQIINQSAYDAARQEKLNKAKAAKAQQIVADFESAVAQITAGYSENQRDTFWKQEQQAREYQAAVDAGQEPPTLKFIENMAVQRGIPVADAVTRILAKSDAFEIASGQALGVMQAREDALAALGDGATLADVEAI